MGTGVEGTEVHQLGAGGASKTCCTATAKAHGTRALGIAGTVVMARTGGTWVHLLLTRGALVAYRAETRHRGTVMLSVTYELGIAREGKRSVENVTHKFSLLNLSDCGVQRPI